MARYYSGANPLTSTEPITKKVDVDDIDISRWAEAGIYIKSNIKLHRWIQHVFVLIGLIVFAFAVRFVFFAYAPAEIGYQSAAKTLGLIIGLLPIIVYVFGSVIFYNPFKGPTVTIDVDISGQPMATPYAIFLERHMLKNSINFSDISLMYQLAIQQFCDIGQDFLDNNVFMQSDRVWKFENTRSQIMREDYRIFDVIFIRRYANSADKIEHRTFTLREMEEICSNLK